MSIETGRSIENSLPLRELLLQDYSGLEKMLVLINIVLFGASLSAENIDQNVSSAILYIMFAIAYYVTTSTCLFGANTLKRKSGFQPISSETNANGQSQQPHLMKDGKPELTIQTPNDNFIPACNNSKSSVGNSKHSSKKQAISGKRSNDTRKSGPNVGSAGSSSIGHQASGDKKIAGNNSSAN